MEIFPGLQEFFSSLWEFFLGFGNVPWRLDHIFIVSGNFYWGNFFWGLGTFLIGYGNISWHSGIFSWLSELSLVFQNFSWSSGIFLVFGNSPWSLENFFFNFCRIFSGLSKFLFRLWEFSLGLGKFFPCLREFLQGYGNISWPSGINSLASGIFSWLSEFILVFENLPWSLENFFF